MEFERKSIRLKEFDYKGNYAYSVTICTYEKQFYFKDGNLVAILLSRLKREANLASFFVFAYCFMPDHLHLLLVGNEKANLIKFIKMFKQKTGFYFKQKYKKCLWQKSFYDHILRKEESIRDVALYIFNNPVRKQIVDDFRKYPYLGSFVVDMREFYAA